MNASSWSVVAVGKGKHVNKARHLHTHNGDRSKTSCATLLPVWYILFPDRGESIRQASKEMVFWEREEAAFDNEASLKKIKRGIFVL